jgi:hypothetical protein
MIADSIAPGLFVATGGHRVGLGVAGAVAERAVELLGIRATVSV